MSAEPTNIRAIRARRTWQENLRRALVSAPVSAKLGMAIIFIYAIAALFAPFIAPYSETDASSKTLLPMFVPGHFLGTDQIGRDTFSRLIFGARNTIGIALLTVGISFCIGGTLGVFAAIMRGWFDLILSRFVDAIMSIPTLIFTLMLLSVFGKATSTLILILAVLDSTRVFRLARNTAMGVVSMDYVEAARLRGEGLNWIMLKEILPNILPPLVSEFGLRFCFVFLTIAALSFLGVGIQPPYADWGSMVAENRQLINFGYSTPLIPAAAIALLTVAVNFVVDWQLQRTSGLRDGQ